MGGQHVRAGVLGCGEQASLQSGRDGCAMWAARFQLAAPVSGALQLCMQHGCYQAWLCTVPVTTDPQGEADAHIIPSRTHAHKHTSFSHTHISLAHTRTYAHSVHLMLRKIIRQEKKESSCMCVFTHWWPHWRLQHAPYMCSATGCMFSCDVRGRYSRCPLA